MIPNEVIKAIGQNMADGIDGEFSIATLYIAIAEGHIKLHGDYRDIKGEEYSINLSRFDPLLPSNILDFHKMLHEKGHAKWNKAIATLTSAGEFNMRFEWDQEYYDELERLSKE